MPINLNNNVHINTRTQAGNQGNPPEIAPNQAPPGVRSRVSGARDRSRQTRCGGGKDPGGPRSGCGLAQTYLATDPHTSPYGLNNSVQDV